MKEAIKKFIRKICKDLIYIWYKIYYRLEVLGEENIPKEGAIIFCANHRSYSDVPLMITAGKRYMRFLAKEELRKNPFIKFLGWLVDAIYVKRDEKDIVAIRKALKTLQTGKCIAIFPEGTRNGITKGKKAKGGIAFLAIKSGAEVLPAGIKGGEKGQRKITITFGKPLNYSQYKENKNKKDLSNITEDIMKNIIKLTK